MEPYRNIHTHTHKHMCNTYTDLKTDPINIQFMYIGKASSKRSDELDFFELLFLFFTLGHKTLYANTCSQAKSHMNTPKYVYTCHTN